MESYTNHPLAPYTTVKIGGPADTFIQTNTTEEFVQALTEAKKAKNQITILGNGSNVLIGDRGIRGTVIKNEANRVEFLPNNQVKVDSGVQLPFLIQETITRSLSGLEEFAYIPSTIGGAIVGNIHGVNKNNFDKFVDSVTVFDLSTSTLNQLPQFKANPDYVIISATLNLIPGSPITSRQIVSDIITKKTTNQPMNSLGCVFKNPQNDSAGRVIDQDLNLKGLRLGDCQISPLHANFIVNLGQGTATDYLALINQIKSTAKTKKNLDLELEIKLLGEF